MWFKHQPIVFFLAANAVIIGITHFQVLFAVLDEWTSSGPYNHGLLGLLLSMYCFWLKRACFIPRSTQLLSIVGYFFGLLLLFVADIACLGQLQQLSVFIIFTMALSCVYGITILKHTFLALMMLALTLPIWNLLQLPLRELSTWVSFHVIDQLFFPVIMQDHHLITANGDFFVEGACSGLGFVLVSALYACFVVQLNRLSNRHAIYFFTAAIITAIIANWLRIIAIVVIGNESHMQHFVVQDHLTFGWFVFAACYLPIIYLGSCFDATQESIEPTFTATQASPSHRLLFLTLSMLTLNGLYFFISSRYDSHYQFTLPTLTNYHKVGNDHHSNPNWFPSYQGATSQQYHYFLEGEFLLQVYVADYAYQRQGQELIYVENTLFLPARWKISQKQQVTLAGVDNINLITLRRNAHQSRLISYWYLIDGKPIGTASAAKWASFKGVLMARPSASLIAVALDFNEGKRQQALNVLSKFSESVIKSII